MVKRLQFLTFRQMEIVMENSWTKIYRKGSIFFMWLKLQWTKEPLRILNEPLPLLKEILLGAPTLFTWKAYGVYKMVIQPGAITLSGKQQHFINIPTKGSETLTFTFYGIKEKIRRTVDTSGKDLSIHSLSFPEKIPLSQLKMDINRAEIPDIEQIYIRKISLCQPSENWFIERHFFKMPLPKVNFNLNTVNIPKFK